MLKKKLFFLLIPLFFISCAAKNEEDMTIDPVMDLKFKLYELAERELSDEHEIDELSAIYEKQIDTLIEISKNDHSIEFHKMMTDPSISTKELQEYIDQWDVDRTQFIRSIFELELQKKNLLGDDLHRRINKKELKLIKKANLIHLEDNQ